MTSEPGGSRLRALWGGTGADGSPQLRSAFAFALPADPRWAGALASVTLSGPGGSVTLDTGSDQPMAIVRDPRTGQIRAILGNRAQAQALAETLDVPKADHPLTLS